MCLIIRHATTNPITPADVDDVYWHNRDGYGAIWRRADGTVAGHRYLPTTAAEAVRAYAETQRRAAADGAVEVAHHWRMATHGAVTLANAHPFALGRYAALLHNGVAPGWGSRDQSDTGAIAAALADVVRGMSPTDAARYLRSDVVTDWLRGEIGASRVVIATVDGLHTLDDGSGVEHADRWYSNTYAWSAPRALSRDTWAGWSGRWTDDRDDAGDVVGAVEPGDMWDGLANAADQLADMLEAVGDDAYADAVRDLANNPTIGWGDDAVDWLMSAAVDVVNDSLPGGVALTWRDGSLIAVGVRSVRVDATDDDDAVWYADYLARRR
jgi:hypothetical protein